MDSFTFTLTWALALNLEAADPPPSLSLSLSPQSHLLYYSQTADMSALRPEFFLEREDGSITPLIALDELPPHISVRGVQRNMTLGEAEGMKNLGRVPSQGAYYAVDSLRDRIGTIHSASDSLAVVPYNGGSKGKSRFSEKMVSFSRHHLHLHLANKLFFW